MGVLCLILGFMEFCYVTVSNIRSIQGPQLDQITNKAHILHNENLELEDQLLHDEAYTTIQQKARQEGFQQAQIIYLR